MKVVLSNLVPLFDFAARVSPAGKIVETACIGTVSPADKKRLAEILKERRALARSDRFPRVVHVRRFDQYGFEVQTQLVTD